jgi:predicted acylesterase/phospholipase RssA
MATREAAKVRDEAELMKPPLSWASALNSEHEAIKRARKRSNLASNPLDPLDHVGLALSGGGIRSATFCLGVLQELASSERLKAVDYLSTVSGGGYVGAWLTAWIRNSGADGLATVVKKLSRKSPVNGEIEAAEISWLRKYSNYLAPRIGFLSADSMTLVVTWTRNVMLNLVVVISLLTSLLLVPRLALYLVEFGIANLRHELWLAAAFLGLFYIPLAISFHITPEARKEAEASTAAGAPQAAAAAQAPAAAPQAAAVPQAAAASFLRHLVLLPRFVLLQCSVHLRRFSCFMGRWWRTTWGVLALVIVPGMLTTLFASIGLFNSKDPVKLNLLTSFQYAGCLVVAAGIAWAASHPKAVFKRDNWKELGLAETSIFLLAYACTLAIGLGLVDYFASAIRPTDKGNNFESVANLLTFGPPSILITFGIAGSIFVGLVGTVYEERTREWWGRMNAWFVTVGLAWLALFSLSFYTPPVLLWVEANTTTWAASLAATGWLGSLALALLVPKASEKKSSKFRLRGAVVEIAAALAVLGFVVVVAECAWLSLMAIASPTALTTPPPANKKIDLRFSSEKQGSKLTYEISEKSAGPLEDFVRVNMRDQQRVAGSSVQLPILGGQVRGTTVFAVVIVLVFVVFGFRVDVNKFSLHNLYKNRLIRCYLGASRGATRKAHPFTGFDEDDDIPLDGNPSGGNAEDVIHRPLHIINTALNITHGENLAWQERKAASFTMTPLHCGFSLGPSTGDEPQAGQPNHPSASGYRPSAFWAKNDSLGTKFSLGMAMATSGAAVSTNMGMNSSPTLAFLLTVFNVRLGRWSPNPLSRKHWMSASPAFAPGCLVQELFGYSNQERSFIHLSDGGHFDNTGVYELVRRKCRTIIAVDASADFDRGLSDLANAIRKCRVDFGAEITVPLEGFQAAKLQGETPGCYAFGTIKYPGVESPGRLIVIKPTLVALAKLSVDVFSYSLTNDRFPHQNTVDQFFDESQFESYRALGESLTKLCFEELREGSFEQSCPASRRRRHATLATRPLP